MEPGRKNHLRDWRRAWRRIQFSLAASCSFALLAVFPAQLNAQQPPSALVAPGNAAVTGFSGALPPIQIAPGADPGRKNLHRSERTLAPRRRSAAHGRAAHGAVRRRPQAFHLQRGGSRASVRGRARRQLAAQHLRRGKLGLWASDRRAGARRPAATYQSRRAQCGLHARLVGPAGRSGVDLEDRRGDRQSEPVRQCDARRPEQFRPRARRAGLTMPIQNRFLSPTARPVSFIASGWTATNSAVTTTASPAARRKGCRRCSWNSQAGSTSPARSSTARKPATWNYAAPERRIFGLAVYQHRLYYAVADSLQVWSVGLKADGAFGSDAVIELAVPPASGPTEISKITFDEQGRMFLAERPAPTGAFDFEALAVPAIGRVLRYAVVGTTADGRRIWQEAPDEYAIGFPRDLRNGNGGVAIGYRYDAKGNLVRALSAADSCGRRAKICATPPMPRSRKNSNNRVRSTSMACRATRPGASGAINEPPLVSYFIDYDDSVRRGCGARPHGRHRHCARLSVAAACRKSRSIRRRPADRQACIRESPGHRARRRERRGRRRVERLRQAVRLIRSRNVTTGACGQCASPNIQINGKCCTVGALAANAACSNSSCPVRANGDRAEQFLLQQQPSLYGRRTARQACCSGPLVNGQCQPSTTAADNIERARAAM